VEIASVPLPPARTTTFVALAAASLLVLSDAVARAATAAPPPPEPPGRPGETGIGAWLGGGWYANDSFNDRLQENEIDPIEGGFEYGLVVRHRLSRYLSLGVDLMRLEGRSSTPAGVDYEMMASPFVINLFGHPISPQHGMDFAVFGGVGLLAGGTIRQSSASNAVEAKQTGFYLHAGAEAEARVGPNLAFTLRALLRHASATGIDFRDISGDPDAIFDIDFNGAAIHFGPRWYFGGKSPESGPPPPAQSK
jgi:hypothetical protein